MLDLSNTTWWWLLAGIAVVVELVTGTFYLLMIGLGLVAAALAAHMGAGIAAQLIAAALVGGGAVAAWHARRGRAPAPPAAQANRDVHLDIGEIVQVDAWTAGGTAQVRYRGSDWSAVPYATASLQSGAHRVREMQGNRLVLEKISAN